MAPTVSVLIAGGGIAGLTAALLLHHHGLAPVLVEKHPGTSPLPKARRINGRSTEVFRLLGLLDAVKEAGAPLVGWNQMLTGSTLADATPAPNPRQALAPGQRPAELSPAPELLCPQDVLEPVLLRAARDRGIDVRFNTRLVSFTQDDTGVHATLQPTDGDEYDLDAQYLIAADGARSPIRTALGTARSGRGHLADNLDISFRANLSTLVADKPFNLCEIHNPAATGALISIDAHQRWVFSTSDFPGASTLAHDGWRDLLRRVVGDPGLDVEVLTQMPWESGMYVADRLSTGRVFLVGDAAHVMPPLAAAGANTAISDVLNLAWKIAAVIDDVAGPSLLATYHDERHPADYATAESSSQVVGNVGDMLSAIARGAGMLGNRTVSLFGTQYQHGALVPDDRGPAPADHYDPAGRPGTRIPHTWLDDQTSTIDLAGLDLALLTGPDSARWADVARELGLRHFSVNDHAWLGQVQLLDDGALLLRPDAIVAWHSSSSVALEDAVGRVLRPAPSEASVAR